MYALSSDVAATLLAATDDMERGWQTIGRVTLAERERARAERERANVADIPIMMIYERIAQECRSASKRTVREYARVVERVGADLFAEFPQFGFDAWRAILGGATMGESVTDVTIRVANGSDVTADAIRAKLRGDLDRPDPFARAVERMRRAAASAIRNARSDEERVAATAIARQIERFAERWCGG